MIIKKAFIGLLLAGGAITIAACGKKNKKTEVTPTSEVTPDPTPAPTPDEGGDTPVVIKYEDYPDVSKYTPYKLGLKDYYLLDDCLDYNNVKNSKYSSIKMEEINNQYAKFGDNIVNMKMVGIQNGTLYSNNSVLYSEMNRKVVIEGTIPQELMVIIPEEYKLDITMKSLTANNNNYLFSKNTYDIGYAPSSMMSTLPPETKTVSSLPSNFNMKTYNSFYPDVDLINDIDTTDENVKVYKIDDTHFVSIVRYIDVENPTSEDARIYNPETKTISETEIDYSIYNFYFQTCYFSVTPSGRYQLDYFFAEEGTKSFYLSYQNTNTIGINEPIFVNVGELHTLESAVNRMLIDYSNQTDYKEKQTFINSFDIDMVSLENVKENCFDAETYASTSSSNMPFEIVEKTFDSITFDAQFNLYKGEANVFVANYKYLKYDSNVIADTAISGSLYNTVTEGSYIYTKELATKLGNSNIVVAKTETEEYLTISPNATLPENTHYEIFVNVTLKKAISKDGTPYVALIINSASAILMND